MDISSSTRRAFYLKNREKKKKYSRICTMEERAQCHGSLVRLTLDSLPCWLQSKLETRSGLRSDILATLLRM